VIVMARPDPFRNDPSAPDRESPVFNAAGRMAPQVTQPSSPWTVALGVAIAVVLGVIVFVSLSAGRQARADSANAAKLAAATPAASSAPSPEAVSLTAPPPPPPLDPARPLQLAQAAPAPASQAVDPATRLHAPVMVVDQSDNRPAAATVVATPTEAGARAAADTGGSAEDKFEAKVVSGGVETSRATQLKDLSRTMPQGTVIPAVLETAINSDLPGSVRAVVSQDVHGFDGSQVLVPRGSKLIGQYRSGVAYGQTRAFVVWSRILTPQGVSIDVGSPATDPLGRGGLTGETDTHFFARFGGSLLLSVIPIALEAALERQSNTAIIIGSPVQASTLASAAPTPKTDIPVTIKVMQGTPLQVFLVRDLDFSGVAAVRP
jgi:type IV secretory pathway VirB10-like protein